jgi:transcription factor IIIB 90 kDa subunit
MEFIKSLALSFNVPSLSPRTITLFNQVKDVGNFRWGNKSRSVAGACLSIALRESNRPDLLRDIASILKIPTAALKREFNSVTSLLKLTLSLVDPSVHITPLQLHLTSALREHQHESGLPASLIEALQPLCLRSVANTAISLSQLFARLNPGHDIFHLPTPPTACGIFMLALEAENRATLNPLSDLAQCLAARCHVMKGVVMARYKTIQDEIALWIEKIPWLDKYESKGGRAKVAKRLIVARGLKDVISFQEEIWQKTVQPVLEFELSDDENEGEVDSSVISGGFDISRPRKRQKISHVLAQATNFLLDPLEHAIPTSKSPASALSGNNPGVNELSLATYILTTSTFACRPPTRLQLLALDRGGVNEAQIPDEDLFAEGELEKMLRNEREVQMLRERYGWRKGEDTKLDEVDLPCNKGRNRRKKGAKTSTTSEEGMGADKLDGAVPIPRKKTRINVEAMALFLADKTSEDGGLEDGAVDDVNTTVMMHLADSVGFSEDEDEEITVLGNLDETHSDEDYQSRLGPMGRNTDEEVVLEHWRSSTPEQGGTDSRYEEEYD